MASVSSTAKVDGVDLQVMVSAATAFARPDARAAAPQETDPQARISPAGKLRSATSAVLDAAATLSKPQTWSATQARSRDEALVQAGGDTAKPGEYQVNVEAMALAQTTASATFSSLSTVIGIGTLNIELGSWNGTQTAFATNPNWPKASVTIGPKDTSLERIKDKINAAGIGVIASVLTDATGSRLVLRATSTGAANGFKVSADPAEEPDSDAAKNLAALGFDPSAVSSDTSTTLLQPAQDARLTIDGKARQSGQNLIEDEDTGLHLTLKAASHTDVTINVEPDPDIAQASIKAFAQAYNKLQNELSPPDPGISAPSVDTARAIQRRVQDVFNPPSGEASVLGSQLKAAGIDLDTQGQLHVDNTRLHQALIDQPEQLEKLFSGENARSPAQSGLAQQVLDSQRSELTNSEATEVNEAPPAPQAQGDTQASQTAAGALFRQKLLEQYAQSDESTLAAQHEDDMAIQANGA